MEFLDKVIELLSNISPVIFTVLVFIVETGLRYIKSEKPLSVVYLVAGAIKKLGVILVKIGEISDKVLPQRLK